MVCVDGELSCVVYKVVKSTWKSDRMSWYHVEILLFLSFADFTTANHKELIDLRKPKSRYIQ